MSLKYYAVDYQSPAVKGLEVKNNRPIETYANGLVRYWDYKGPLSEKELTKIVENYSVYKAAAEDAGIPWQMLAATHYRESSLSIKTNPQGGPFRFDNTEHHEGEEEFGIGAYYAARLIQQKSGYRLAPNTEDPHIIKDAFWGYNGRAYGSYDKSPYVMNKFDGDHENMRIKGTDIDENGNRFSVNIRDEQLGAYVVYLELKKAFQ